MYESEASPSVGSSVREAGGGSSVNVAGNSVKEAKPPASVHSIKVPCPARMSKAISVRDSWAIREFVSKGPFRQPLRLSFQQKHASGVAPSARSPWLCRPLSLRGPVHLSSASEPLLEWRWQPQRISPLSLPGQPAPRVSHRQTLPGRVLWNP